MPFILNANVLYVLLESPKASIDIPLKLSPLRAENLFLIKATLSFERYFSFLKPKLSEYSKILLQRYLQANWYSNCNWLTPIPQPFAILSHPNPAATLMKVFFCCIGSSFNNSPSSVFVKRFI